MHKEMHTRTWEALYIVLIACFASTALETRKAQPETGLGADVKKGRYGVNENGGQELVRSTLKGKALAIGWLIRRSNLRWGKPITW